MAFNVNEVVRVDCQSRSWFVLYAPRETFSPFSRGVNISTTQTDKPSERPRQTLKAMQERKLCSQGRNQGVLMDF